MACLSLHLAIAKNYLKQQKNLNYEEVIKGTLYPDAASDNDKHIIQKRIVEMIM